MFNLEQSIAQWRGRMLAAGITASARLDELESHLREDIRVFLEAGEPEAQAFQLAVARLGSPASVKTEFNKLEGSPIWTVKIASALWVAAVMLLAGFFLRGLLSGKLNLLLYAHVLSVTAGYLAAFLIGGFGICYVWYRSFRSLSPLRKQSLARAVYWFSHVALGLVMVGTVLGMVWARQNWGRYWGWDPKEVGGLCVALWFTGLVLRQRFGQASDHVLALMCMGGNVIVSMAWFGPFMFDKIGRNHGYGVGAYWPLAIFLALTFCFFTLELFQSKTRSSVHRQQSCQ